MQIRSFVVRDFKRIKEANIDLSSVDSALVLIGGKNGAGKSSALDALAVALWGSKMSPANPIREGQATAEVVVELEGYSVRRAWRRTEKGDVATDVTVTTDGKNRARIEKPQTWLDARLSKLACDPVAFLALEPAKQAEMLRKLVGIDTTTLDGRIDAAFAARADLRRDGEKEKAVLASMPRHDDAPADPVVPELVQAPPVDFQLISAADVVAELEAAVATERAAEVAAAALQTAARNCTLATERLGTIHTRIDRLRAELDAAESELAGEEERAGQLAATRVAASDALDAARAAVIPTAPIRARLSSIEADNNATRQAAADASAEARRKAAEANAQARAAADIANEKRRANAAHAAKSLEVDRLRAEWTAKNNEVEALRAEKAALLAAAKFPVPGLSFGEKGGVTFQGQPLEQASGAEKIRVSMAIALASAPAGDDGIKLVLIRDASLLDEDSLELVARVAEEAGAQVILERVGTRDPGAIIIVDGGTV